jgi:hypothetical protein
MLAATPAAASAATAAYSGSWGENISVRAGKSAREIVIALIIDDGLRSRKHRDNIFSTNFSVAGAATGRMRSIRTIASMAFRRGYSEGANGGSAAALFARQLARERLPSAATAHGHLVEHRLDRGIRLQHARSLELAELPSGLNLAILRPLARQDQPSPGGAQRGASRVRQVKDSPASSRNVHGEGDRRRPLLARAPWVRTAMRQRPQKW